MDTVVLDGVEYITAASAAKKFKYTSDYVGQLCRAKKIDARLVGRAWFVNPTSLVAYKQNVHNEVTSTSTSTDNKDIHKVAIAIVQKPDKETASKAQRTSVGAVIKSKTFKAFADQAASLPDSGERKLHVTYERDQEQLMPVIHRKHTRPAKTIRIENAGAQKIRISGGKQHTTYKADEIPSFALSGKLKVEPLLEADSQVEAKESENKVEIKPNNIAISANQDNNTAPLGITAPRIKLKKSTDVGTKLKIATSQDELEKPTAQNVHQKPKQTGALKNSSSVATTVSFTPAIVANAKPKPKTKVTPRPRKASWIVLASPLIFTGLATLMVVAIFAGSNTTVISDQLLTSEITFNLTNFMNIFSE